MRQQRNAAPAHGRVAVPLPVRGGGGHCVVKIGLHGRPEARRGVAQRRRPWYQLCIQRRAEPLRGEGCVQSLGIEKELVFIAVKAGGENPPRRPGGIQRGGERCQRIRAGLPRSHRMAGPAADPCPRQRGG